MALFDYFLIAVGIGAIVLQALCVVLAYKDNPRAFELAVQTGHMSLSLKPLAFMLFCFALVVYRVWG